MSEFYRESTGNSTLHRNLLRAVRCLSVVCLAALCLSVSLLLFCVTQAQAADAPTLTQAATWHQGIDLRAYWVSEKLDGVRGYWNGQALIFRSGAPINAPDWFTSDFPDTALDGELWLGRQRFDELSGLLRRKVPQDEDWKKVRFMIFDLPLSPLDFDHRLAQLDTLIAAADIPWLQLIEQVHFASVDTLHIELERVVALGGEGLMLHKGSALYHGVRNDDLIKLKPLQDAEARVVAWFPGKGRLRGMLGSLLVKTPEGIQFRLGTGFSDAERRNPPPIGSLVTYQFSGLTRKGVPKFARYLRIRDDF